MIRGYSSEVRNTDKPIRVENTRIKSPRSWQQKCRLQVRGKRFSIISAPCGSGKSFAMILRSLDDIVDSNFKQRVLIVVPQSVIADGFTRREEIKIDGKIYLWNPSYNFFKDSGSILVGLKRWLLTTPFCPETDNVDGLVAITSHSALGRVWKELSKGQKIKAMNRLTLVVDECHHIAGVFHESSGKLNKEELDEANNLGSVVHDLINSSDKTAKVCLGTATFFRGDTARIISPKIRTRFESGTFVYSMIEHWPSLNLKYARMQYEFYKHDPIDLVVRGIKREPNNRHLVYVPATGNGWRRKSSMNRFFQKLYRVVPRHQVLDLVTPETQEVNKSLFAREPKHPAEGKPQFKVIVACGIGLEGLDWVPADRLWNLGAQNSLTRTIQVSGRPLRYWPDKKTIVVKNLVPQFIRLNKAKSIEELLADRTTALLVSLSWDDLASPVSVRMEVPAMNLGTNSSRAVPLPTAVGLDYENILTDIIQETEILDDKTNEAIEDIIRETLQAYKAPVSQNIVDGLLVKLRRAQLKSSPSTKAQKLVTFFDVSMLRTKHGFNILKKHRLNKQTILFGDFTNSELKRVSNLIWNNLDEFIEEWNRLQA